MEANDVKRVVVVGAGVMGHSIAQAFAQAGIDVNLVDVNENILNRAIRLIEGNLETLAEHGRVTLDALPANLSRIHPATDLAAVWMLLPDADERRAALDRYDPDPALARRARGWAVSFGVLLLDAGLVDHPRYAEMGDATMVRLEHDAAARPRRLL